MNTLILIIAGTAVSIAILALAAYRRSHPVAVAGDPRAAGATVTATVYEPIQVTRNTPPIHKKHYYGVSVRPGVNCCDAIKAITRNRYLQGQAPRLPLPECDRGDCRCIMQPENDRRTQIDRRADAFSAYGEYRDAWHPRRRQEAQDRREN